MAGAIDKPAEGGDRVVDNQQTAVQDTVRTTTLADVRDTKQQDLKDKGPVPPAIDGSNPPKVEGAGITAATDVVKPAQQVTQPEKIVSEKYEKQVGTTVGNDTIGEVSGKVEAATVTQPAVEAKQEIEPAVGAAQAGDKNKLDAVATGAAVGAAAGKDTESTDGREPKDKTGEAGATQADDDKAAADKAAQEKAERDQRSLGQVDNFLDWIGQKTEGAPNPHEQDAQAEAVEPAKKR